MNMSHAQYEVEIIEVNGKTLHVQPAHMKMFTPDPEELVAVSDGKTRTVMTYDEYVQKYRIS